VSLLHALRDGFTDEHLPMFVLLGLASGAEHVVQLLQVYRETQDDAPSTIGRENTPDDLLALALGVIAVHESLQALRNDSDCADRAREADEDRRFIGSAGFPPGILR